MMHSKIILALFFFLFIGFGIQAQTPALPVNDLSEQVLKILDNTKGITLNADQKSSLSLENKTFVDQLFKITSGTDSEDVKKTNILNLKNSRSQILTTLLGKQLLGKYSGSILKAIGPLKSKLGLAALAF
jgi:hypothetical protein